MIGGIWGVVALLVAVLTGEPGPVDAGRGEWTQSERYVTGPGGYVHGLCADDPRNPSGRNVSAVCFEWTEATEVTIDIADDSGLPVGAWAGYLDADGRSLGTGWAVCGGSTIPTVAEWRTLRLFLAVAGGVTACPAGTQGANVPTKGVVTARFRPAPSGAAARPALRTGRIIDGENATGPIGACHTMPDCAAWLASDCHPGLAGRDPALYSSIVDVAGLADGTSERFFEALPGNPAGAQLGGMYIELWDAHCNGLRSWAWWDIDCGGTAWRCHATVTISEGAKWMTVTSNGNAHMRWALT